MKKFSTLVLILVLALSMCITLASCDNSNGDTSSDAGTSSSENSNDENAYSDLIVGAIYINSQNDTAGYTYAHHNGITKAMQELGIPESNLYVVDNVLENDTDVRAALNTLASKGCKIIFGISFGYLTAFDEAAKDSTFDGIILSHATGYLASDDSGEYATQFNNYFGRIYQARYLAGIAAGLKSLEVGNNNVGYVAAYGLDYAETCSGINSFALGVQAVNPDAKLYVKTLNTWADEAKEKAAAESLIDTYGCGVISQHCDSAQPQMVAQSKNVFGCGYNSDMTSDAPDAHLTAAIWNWNVYYRTAMECAATDPENFMTKVGIYYGGLKEGMVDVSPLSENCSAGTQDAIDQVKALIVSGEWDVFSGVKLSISVTDGKATVTKTDADLKQADGTVIVAAGGASVDDGVIKGSMDYYVEGVEEK